EAPHQVVARTTAGPCDQDTPAHRFLRCPSFGRTAGVLEAPRQVETRLNLLRRIHASIEGACKPLFGTHHTDQFESSKGRWANVTSQSVRSNSTSDSTRAEAPCEISCEHSYWTPQRDGASSTSTWPIPSRAIP